MAEIQIATQNNRRMKIFIVKQYLAPQIEMVTALHAPGGRVTVCLVTIDF